NSFVSYDGTISGCTGCMAAFQSQQDRLYFLRLCQLFHQFISWGTDSDPPGDQTDLIIRDGRTPLGRHAIFVAYRQDEPPVKFAAYRIPRHDGPPTFTSCHQCVERMQCQFSLLLFRSVTILAPLLEDGLDNICVNS